MNTTVVSILVIVGLAFLALAALYWLTPAGELPAFVPGFAPGSTKTALQPWTGRAGHWIGGARVRVVPQPSAVADKKIHAGD